MLWDHDVRGENRLRAGTSLLASLFVSIALIGGFAITAGARGAPPGLVPSLDSLACDVDEFGKPPPEQGGSMADVAPPAPPYRGFNEDVVADVHGIAPADYVRHVRAIGGNSVRTNIDWRNAEPKRDCWDETWWANWREVYRAAVEAGVRPIFIISASPGWARDPAHRSCNGYAGCVFPPSRQFDGEWAEFAAEVARRFPQAMIEVWNEPNIDGMWSSGPDPERFAELVVIANEAIDGVDPSIPVILGGLLAVRKEKDSGMRMREFLTRAYEAPTSVRGNVDYIGLHPYTTRGRIGPGSAFADGFRTMRLVRDAQGDSAPIFVTEFGVSLASPGITEARQARVLGRVDRRLRAADDVAGVVYHRIVEPRDTTGDAIEMGYAWMLYGQKPNHPRQVFCEFAARAKAAYPGCRVRAG